MSVLVNLDFLPLNLLLWRCGFSSYFRFQVFFVDFVCGFDFTSINLLSQFHYVQLLLMGSFPNRRVAEILFLLLQWQHSVEFRFCCDDKRKEKEKEDHVKNWMWRLPFYGTLLFNHWLWLGLTWIEIDKSLVGCNQMCPMCLYIEIDIWTSACPSNFNRMLRFSNWLNTIALW